MGSVFPTSKELHLRVVEKERDEAERQLEEVQCAHSESLRVIRAEHAAKASVGGSPCICRWCKP